MRTEASRLSATSGGGRGRRDDEAEPESDMQRWRDDIAVFARRGCAAPDGEDFDLHVRRDAPPTTDQYDMVGFTNSAGEDVAIAPVELGEYYIMVRSYRRTREFESLSTYVYRIVASRAIDNQWRYR
jgi:hypothetical protein